MKSIIELNMPRVAPFGSENDFLSCFDVGDFWKWDKEVSHFTPLLIKWSSVLK